MTVADGLILLAVFVLAQALYWCGYWRGYAMGRSRQRLEQVVADALAAHHDEGDA